MELLVVVYHYIDDENKYQAGIYPTSPERLALQLDLIRKNWQFISEDDLVKAIKSEAALPEKACLITFDDGLRSQYEQAVPILEERNIPAVFFLPSRHLTERKAYRAHKVHYLLSQVPVPELLAALERIYQDVTGSPLDWSGLDAERASIWYRYDDKDTARFKFFINHFSNSDAIDAVVGRLFSGYYEDESHFCAALYMPESAITYLNEHKLFSVGMHTHSHFNVAREERDALIDDIIKNRAILSERLNVAARGIAYPFGSMTSELYEEKLRSGLEPLGLSYGFTTEKKLNTSLHNSFLLGRFGANDITGGKRPLFVV